MGPPKVLAGGIRWKIQVKFGAYDFRRRI